LRVRAPDEELRHRLRNLFDKGTLVAVAARFRLSEMTLMTYWWQPSLPSVLGGSPLPIALSAEIAELDAQLNRVVWGK
jgi:hypothetical protein